MKAHWMDNWGGSRLFRAAGLGMALAASAVHASDHDAAAKEWHLDTSLSKEQFSAAFDDRSGKGFRVVDFEVGDPSAGIGSTAVWAKEDRGDKWHFRSALTFETFMAEQEKYSGRRYALVDFEVDRVGATLSFSGVWLRDADRLDTVFHYGMDSLLFSNRYGEMADKGFRLIDFEAYEANGKTWYGGIWTRKKGEVVRFYRGLSEEAFGKVAERMHRSGYRIIDMEGYLAEGERRYAAAWERLDETQAGQYAFNLSADQFYQKNADYESEGYRLIDFEVRAIDGQLPRYFGTWVREAAAGAEGAGSFLDGLR